MEKINYPPHEHLTHVMLQDLGFERVDRDDLTWRHDHLEPFNIRVVDWGNGGWHFVVRNTSQGIGKMKCLDDLIVGFKFVTGKNVLELSY